MDMDSPLKNQIIYQYCLHNHENQYDMLNRIHHTIKGYKQEMNDIEKCFNIMDVFRNENQIILCDIIPSFLKPTTIEFDFNHFEDEYHMENAILKSVTKFTEENLDIDETLVIRLIHSI